MSAAETKLTTALAAALLYATGALAGGTDLSPVQVTPPVTRAEVEAEMAQAWKPPTHLEPVRESGPRGLSDMRKAVFPEAFASDAMAWMDAEYAGGSREEMTVLERTDRGFRLVYLFIPAFLEDYMTDEAQPRLGLPPGGKPKVERCVYDIPQALGHRVLAAERAVLRKTRPNPDQGIVFMGVDFEFSARDGANVLRGQVSNPRADSEPAMLATVFTRFEHTCSQDIGYSQDGDLESNLGQLERHLRKEKQR
jgi:hypothetical protein